MARHRGRQAGPAVRLLALTALALTSAGIALCPATDAAASRGRGGGDGNGVGSRYVVNNGQNNLNSLFVGSQRNLSGTQQTVAGVDASVNTQASNCKRRPGCRGSQNLVGRNQSSPRVIGTVVNGRR
ncbi:hypothetical protein GCM10010116_54910 [Microbispora rosea subsp. aerata]|nr:hypothetical protein [Microbispora rosea]GGO27394.1 hypothetical protein GCM10010116_54910 [Microbispora rosea subsp. aerata]GIH57643.1 hypothetical protein Mro02_45570 [Microbispora rosea subsp. aerata]GLJ86821.1 hypothetical protein GCM10017588_55620 [Microbispora rosea subsp. aerata]